jgi:DNA replication and repair protein RecF
MYTGVVVVRSVELKDFRNHAATRIELSAGLNFFVGDNAQGKTNLLEAIYMTCVGVGFRAARDREVIKFGNERAVVRTTAEKKFGQIDVEVCVSSAPKNSGKQIKINGIPIAKMGELMGTLTCVFFCPDELKLIKESPADRRRFLDIGISQIDKKYFYNLLRFNRILKQRNALLKTIGTSADEMRALDIWDSEMATISSAIIDRRRAFVSDIAELSQTVHAEIAPTEKLSIDLETNVAADILAAIKSARPTDLRLRTTTVGCHRDDLAIRINGIDARTFASQGQQRSTALSLKIAEMRMFERLTGEKPILLLDDVLSELDPARQKRLFGLIRGTQTIITAATADGIPRPAKIFRVANGAVETHPVDNSVQNSVPKTQNPPKFV